MLVLRLGFSFLIFSLVCFFAFFLPGLVILNRVKTKFTKLETLFLSLVLGLVILPFSAFILGYLQLRFLLLPLIILFGLYGLAKHHQLILDLLKPRNWKLNKYLVILLAIGIPVQLIINFPSGLLYQDGLRFWSAHGHDGVWHIALIKELKDFFPPQIPNFAGETLKNYHFFVDLLMAEFFRLFKFSPLDLYFRFFPFLFSLLLGLGVFVLLRRWQKNEKIALWGVFFAYFMGSFGYWLTIFRNRNISGETVFWVSQTNTLQGNPSLAASFVILLAFLLIFLKYLDEKKRSLILLGAFLGGTLIEFKVYAGVIVIAGLFVLAIFEFLFRKEKLASRFFISSLPFAFFVYLPNNLQSSNLLVFEPWWFVRTMVVSPERLNMIDWEHRRQYYLSLGTFRGLFRAIQLEASVFLIFLLGNLGIRFLGFFELFRLFFSKRRINFFTFSLIIFMLTAFLFPMLFLQKGVAYNTGQSFQYFLFIFSFFAAISAYQLTQRKNKLLKTTLIVIIVVLSIPTVIGNIREFSPDRSLAKISHEEIEALEFLKKVSQREDIILTYPFDLYAAQGYQTHSPIPIHAWSSTAYVSFLSDRRTYLSDEGQAEILGYPKDMRLEKIIEFFQTDDIKSAKELLGNFKVDYVYLVWDQPLNFEAEDLGLENIFENDWAKVFEVK